MSEIAKKDASKAAAIANGANAVKVSSSERSRLLQSPEHLELDLEAAMRWCTGTMFMDEFEVPRLGVLSLLLQTVPCRVYGHPEMKKKFGKTAFTDGHNIFICDEFYEKMNRDADASKQTEFGIELLLAHEGMHVLFNHVFRLLPFPPRIRNRATDLSINTKLQVGFPDLKWCKTLRETGIGFNSGDTDRYPSMSEETIARELVNDEIKRQQEQDKKDKKKKPSQGQGDGQPGDQDQDQDDSDEDNDNEQEDTQDQDQKPGDEQDNENDVFGSEDDNHLVDIRDMIDALTEMGLEEVLDALDYPQQGDEDAIAKREEESMQRKMDAIQNAASTMAQNGGKYPGAHIVDAAAEMVQGFIKGKLSFKLALRQAMLGDGQHFKYDDEESNVLYHVDEVTEAVGTEVWEGQDLPYKKDEKVLVIIDTSGSVSESDIRAFLSEVFELKTASSGYGDSAAEVIVVCGDTVMRGEPTEITDSNVDELLAKGVKIFGRGGTDVERSVKDALELPQFREKKVRSVIVMTDLYTSIPDPEVMGVPKDCAFVYVTAPSTSMSDPATEEAFAKGVESYARVVSIREGTEVDLSESFRSMPRSPGKRARMGA